MGSYQSALLPFPAAFRLTGELALVTGGGSGLGFGMARCLTAAGARVVLVGRNEERLKSAVEELGEPAVYETCDLDQLDEIPVLAQRVAARYGPVSILINNAGNHLKKPALETADGEFAAVIQTHVMAAFSLTREIARGMVERRHGSILFTASMASFLGIPWVAAYSTAKAAYLGMVRSLAAEFSPCGVRVNGIAPGWVMTSMTSAALDGDPARRQRILDRTPLGRFGTVEDIGWAAVYLCSQAGCFVSGVVLPVDGGARIGF